MPMRFKMFEDYNQVTLEINVDNWLRTLPNIRILKIITDFNTNHLNKLMIFWNDDVTTTTEDINASIY